MNPRQAFARAVALFGSEEALGAAIGFSQNSVWRARRFRATAEMANNIEFHTKGEVKREWLRPDLFGPELQACKHSWSRRGRSRRINRRAA